MIKTWFKAAVNFFSKAWQKIENKRLFVALVVSGVILIAGFWYLVGVYNASLESDRKEKSDEKIKELDVQAGKSERRAESSSGKADQIVESKIPEVERRESAVIHKQEKLKEKADAQENNLNSNAAFRPRGGVKSAELDSLLRSVESQTPER